MRQRIARATKSMAVVAAAAATVPWIAERTSTTATTSADAFSLPVASRSQRNKNENENGGSSGIARDQQQQQQQLNVNSAFTAFSLSSIHRSTCDASAPSPTPPPFSWSFLSSFLGGQKESSETTTTTDIDETCFERVKTPDRCSAKQHAIFGTLAGETMIESYQVYRPKKAAFLAEDNNNNDSTNRGLMLVGVVDFGTHLNGHGGVVHGGILSLMFDDIMGWACNELMDSSSSSPPKIFVTANLNVDFRKPVMEGSRVMIKVYLDKQEGRKYFWRAEMLGGGKDGGEDGLNGERILYAEATSLYIVLRDKN